MVQLQIDDDHMEYMPCDEIYVVREGETLQTITEKCGDPYIVDENPHIDDSDDVFPGLVIKITPFKQRQNNTELLDFFFPLSYLTVSLSSLQNKCYIQPNFFRREDYDSDDGGVRKLATLHVSGKDSEVEFVLDVNV